AVEPSGRLPVDPAHLVPRGVLAEAPKVRPLSQLSGRNLSEPGAGAPRLELRAPEVFHRRRDDEPRVRRRTASSAPRASGSRDRTRTGPMRKSPFTGDRTV